MKLLIADYAATRAGIRVLLDDEHWEVCAEAEDATEAIAAAAREAPDVCVIGLDLPGGAITAVREISQLRPDLAIVVLASSHDADDLLAVLRAGARGYAVPGIDAQGLQRVLRAVAAGEAAVPRSLVLELVRELQGGAGGVAGLTSREAQVLGMLRRGQSTSAIALRLGISPVTVRRHISTLVQKTGVEDRTALAELEFGVAEAVPLLGLSQSVQ